MTTTTPLNFYLAVHKPDTIWTARLASLPTAPYMTIAYNSAVQVRAPLVGETVWFGTTPGGRELGLARLRTAPNGTSFTVGANSAVTPYLSSNCYISIKEEFRLWPIYPRITGSVAALYYMDYDVTYSDQNSNYRPMALAGPPAAGFLSGGTCVLNFVGEYSYNNRNGTNSNLTPLWTAVDSDEGTSSSLGTVGSPVTFTWHTAGVKLVSLDVLDTVTGKHEVNYTYAFIFDSSDTESGESYGASRVYKNFDKASISTDYANGGAEASFVINGLHDVNQFPEESMVVLFYDGDLITRTATWPYRENILYTGWITKDTVTQVPNKNSVQFNTQGIVGLLKNTSTFPISMEDAITPVDWTQMKGLCVTRIISFIAQQMSTLSKMASITLMPNTKFMKFYETTDTTIYNQLSQLTRRHFGSMVASMQGVLYSELNYQYMLSSERSSVAVRKEINASNWTDNLSIDIISSWARPVSMIKTGGFSYDSNPGHDVGAFLSKAPGDLFYLESGQTRDENDFIVLDQSELNSRTGLLLAQSNNKYPIVRTNAINDGSFDVAPQEIFRITIPDERVNFSSRYSLPRRVRHTLDSVHGVLKTSVEFEPDSSGAAGVTVILPKPIDASYPPPPVLTLPPFNFPPLPTGCPPGTIFNPSSRRCEFGFLTGTFIIPGFTGTYPPIGWPHGTPPQTAYLSTASGVYLTNNLWATTPIWVNTSSGLVADSTNGYYARFISVDPRAPAYQYCLDVYDANSLKGKIGRGTVGAWSTLLNSATINSQLGYASATVRGITTSDNKVAGWIGAIFTVDSGPVGTSFETRDFYFTYSDDYGVTWQPAVLAGTITRDGAQQFDNIELFGTYTGIYKDSSTHNPGDLIYIEVVKTSVGASGFGSTAGTRIFVSTDGGAAWVENYTSDANGGSSSNDPGPDGYVRVDPTEPETLFATSNFVSDSLLRSTNRGNSWTNLGNVNTGDADRYLNNNLDIYNSDLWNIAPIAVFTGSTFSTELYSFCVADNGGRQGIFNNILAKFTWDNFLGSANPVEFITGTGLVMGTPQGINPPSKRTFGAWNDHRDPSILYALCLDSMAVISGVSNADAILYASFDYGHTWLPKTSASGGIAGLTRWTYGLALDYGVISGSVDAFAYYFGGRLYNITSVSPPGGGISTPLEEWFNTYQSTYAATAFMVGLPHKLCIVGSKDIGGGNYHMFFANSTDDGLTWTLTDCGVDDTIDLIGDSDRFNRDSMWVLNSPDSTTGAPYLAWHSGDGGITFGSAITYFAGDLIGGYQTIAIAPGAGFCYAIYSRIISGTPTVTLFKILNNGTVSFHAFVGTDWSATTQNDYPLRGYSLSDACVDPTNTDIVHMIGSYNDGILEALYTVDFGANTISMQVLPGLPGAGTITGVFVTTHGTIICTINYSTNYFMRSTDGGNTWTNITIGEPTLSNWNYDIMTEANGLLIIALDDDFSSDGNGRFLYSFDDGLTWQITGILGTSNTPAGFGAR